MNKGFSALLDELKKQLSGVASNVAKTAGDVVNKVSKTPISVGIGVGGTPIPGTPFKINPVIGPKKQVTTIGGAASTAADFTYRPVARIGFEGAQTIAGDKRTYQQKGGFGKLLLGDQPLVAFNNPNRPAQKFVRENKLPGFSAYPLIAAGAAIDLVPVNPASIVGKGGTKTAIKVGEKAVAKDTPKIVANIIKKAPSVLSVVLEDGRKIITELTPKELNFLKNEVKNIPAGFPQLHLDAVTSNLKRELKSGTIQKVTRDEFFKAFPKAQEVLSGITKTPSVSIEATSKTLQKVAKREAAALENLAKTEYKEWEKNLFQSVGATKKTANKVATDIAKTIGGSTRSPLSDPTDLNDISGFTAGMRDVYRNFKVVFGKNFETAKRVILDPFDAAKGRYIDEQKKLTDDVYENVVKGLGIKKGSQNSALIQMFGEGKISLDDLKKAVPKDWEKIVQGDAFFRSRYDRLIDEINVIRKRIYPNNPDKLVPKRQDYYRHFKELATGIQGLTNIFETPAQISSKLAGVSEFAKPKAKWASFMQKRLGDKTEYDAVGGFLDYIKSFSYSKHIDPEIGKFRNLADELAEATADGPNAGKVNNFIEFLQDFANDLSGKTNPWDRTVQKWIPGGRKTFRVLDWLNSRVKANTVLGNAGSSINQIFNVPNGIADAGPVNAVKGVGRTLANIFKREDPMSASNFIKERYASSIYDKFDSKLIDQPKKLAVWMLTVMDEMGTKFIWNAEYEKAIAAGVKDAVKYADDATRAMVAGRGVGEVPLAQKAKLFQLVAPFQLEVGNAWWVMKDFVDQKAFGKIATLFLSTYLLNNAVQKVTGNRIGFDPIQAMQDAFDPEEPLSPVERVGRLGGEVLSNVPFGQTVAALYPEYGINGGPTRKELFGRQDPTRFGSGLLVTKGVTDPLFKVLPAYGGGQIKKMLQGTKAIVEGGKFDKNDRLQYPINDSLLSKIQKIVFGPYADSGATFYFRNDLRPLSDQETRAWKMQVQEGADPYEAWAAIYTRKLNSNMRTQISKIRSDSSLSREEKKKEADKVMQEFKLLRRRLVEFGNVSDVEALDDSFPPLTGGASSTGSASGGKKGKKPAAPKSPKFVLKKNIKSSSSPKAVFKIRRNAPSSYFKSQTEGGVPDIDTRSIFG